MAGKIEKVTPMVLNVNLQCPCCYKKIKKTLCKFPQIRDQVYNEKTNTVNITVVCCSPEKIRDKLKCKAGKVIISIEIKEPPKPKEPEKKKEPDKPKESEKPKEPEKPKEAPEKPKSNGKADKPKSDAAPPADKPKEAPKAEPPKNPQPAAKAAPAQTVPVHGVPSVFPYVGPSYDTYGAGPYYHGYGFPPPPPPPQPCYDGYYGYGYGNGYGYGYGRVGHASRCGGYYTEENPQGCYIM